MLMIPIRGRKECRSIPQQAQISVKDRWRASAWHDRALKLQQDLKGARSQLAAEHKAGRELADCFAVDCIGYLGARRQEANRTCDTERDMKETRVALANIVPDRHAAFFSDWKGTCECTNVPPHKNEVVTHGNVCLWIGPVTVVAGYKLSVMSQARHGVGHGHQPAILHEHFLSIAAVSGSAARKLSAATPGPQPRTVETHKNTGGSHAGTCARLLNDVALHITVRGKQIMGAFQSM
jgi:hypothetical protein